MCYQLRIVFTSQINESSWKFFTPVTSYFILLNLRILMQLMILVDDAGGIVPVLNHSPWNGLTIADFVMPFFLFIVGVSLALTYKVCLKLLYN